jgi:hypothetical protein
VVSRTAKKIKSRSDRVRMLPWAAVLQAAAVVGSRWRKLSSKERERVRGLLRQSGGRPGNLSPRERKELRKLAGKLDLKGMGKDLMALRRGRGRLGRRRGH